MQHEVKSSSRAVIPFRIYIYFLHLVLGRKLTQQMSIGISYISTPRDWLLYVIQ